ncbi:MAG: hypothetical protein ACLFWG_00125 [Longimicrobiales bacterium]
MARYNLSLPDDTYEELQRLAEERGESVKGVLMKFVRLGLYVDEIRGEGGTVVTRSEDGTEREVVLL